MRPFRRVKPYVFAVAVLAAYRITRFVIADSLLGSIRARWFIRWPPTGSQSHPLGQLLDCSYCTGFWVSAAVFAVAYWGGRVGFLLLAVWAVAGGQALLSAADRRINA